MPLKMINKLQLKSSIKKPIKRKRSTAQYLIAADGANSSLRKLFNIEMEGIDNLGEFCNIYCEMNLDKYVKHRPSVGFMFTRPDLRGTFILSKDGHKKWLIGVRIDPNRNLTKESFTDDFCIDYVIALFATEKPGTHARFVLMTGELNHTFSTQAMARTFEYFERHFPGRNTYQKFPGYGHMDVWVGKNAHKDVFPFIVDELNRPDE